jgi:molybdenum storage protein
MSSATSRRTAKRSACSDAGSYLMGEVFGARAIILLKDVDGLFTADPKTHPDARFIAEIGAAELIAMRLETLPI